MASNDGDEAETNLMGANREEPSDCSIDRMLVMLAAIDEAPQLFTEMQELLAGRWVQTTRWVKYEETVEVDGSRWSNPHVASFDGMSMECLQYMLTNGICQFYVDFEDIDTLAEKIGEAAFDEGHVDEEQRRLLQEAITTRHYHLHEASQGAGGLFVKSNVISSRQVGLRSPEKEKIEPKVKEGKLRVNKKIAKKLEKTAEGAAILVGAVEFLEKPLFVFFRRQSSGSNLVLNELTEASVPLRFVCVVLGPIQRLSIMREAGRVMGAALSEHIFQTVARSANSKEDLLAGLKNFWDHATVLAPSQWNPAERLGPPKKLADDGRRKRAIDYTAELEQETQSPLLDKPKEQKYAVHLPPGLQVTGVPFGGLIADIKRKAPHYLSDFTDAFSVQCLAAVLFLYFVILAQLISFGGLLGEATDKNIATLESIISVAVNGAMYHVLAAQPLTIISTTGPVLVFERLTFNFTDSWGWGFLEFRFWIGMWMSLILLVIIMFDLSFMVCFITRFTEDNFAALIATIFIFEAIKKAASLYKTAPVDFNPPNNYTCDCQWRNGTYQNDWLEANQSGSFASLGWTPKPDTVTMSPVGNATNATIPACEELGNMNCSAWSQCVGVGPGCGKYEPIPDVFLFSMLLFLGTFIIANMLKDFRFAPYFPRLVRVNISDFAVFITIALMVLVDWIAGLPTLKLEVPTEFNPTNPNRGWIVSPFDKNPVWSIAVAFPFGLLAAILLFMDHQITTVIVNRKEHLIKKGFGYHLDLLVVVLVVIIGSVFGITWLVAATVLAVGHINSLRKESEAAAPGEQPKFLGLREQRLTGILIFVLIGLSILLRDVLAMVPMAVLYGCFLYMGVNVLRGCGNFHRLLLVFMPRKNQPDYLYLKHVRLWRVHLFTFFQLVSFAILWGLKEIKAVSMLFPLMLVVMVFIRKGLDRLFTEEELFYLDDIMPPFHIPRAAKPKTEKEKNDDDDDDDNAELTVA